MLLSIEWEFMKIINSLEVKQYQVTVVHILLDDHDNDLHTFDMETDFARLFFLPSRHQ